ncbi:uncharacterized protein EAF02_006114 [Botrytis sinoallii]|uniref:uncharacterized protein n=1 Tax=Botrytis sinoallii TaxID=1463999 RepID=UPI0018FF3DA4|nr:uncharacterized protein EAF02_006114 [Botrytis sinoallii]KAF7882751.1 hypothetical protein EAF02_006114 [Botrytis sinoallii]
MNNNASAVSLRKRKNSDVSEDISPTPSKAIKLENSDNVEERTDNNHAEATVTPSVKSERSAADVEEFDVQSHISELYRFIISERALGRAPMKIQRLINMDSASRNFYASSIRDWIDQDHGDFLERYSHKPDSRINFKATRKYLADIGRLSRMSRGASLAFELALYLCEHSYLAPDNGKIPRTSRAVCGPCDSLVHKLCLRMKDEYPNFEPEEHLSRVNDQRKHFEADDDDLIPHLLRTRDLLVSWVEGPSAAQAIYDSTKELILTDYNHIVEKLQSAVARNHSSSSRSSNVPGHLVPSVEKSLPQVKRLLSMAGAKGLAFDLLLFAGRHSYVERKKDLLGRKVTENFDQAADNLLVQISNAIREEDPTFRPVDAMEMLIEEIEATGHNGYFPESYKLFSSWMPEVGKSHARKDYDELHAKIKQAHAAVERRLEIFVKDGSRPTVDLLGRKMVGFVDDVNKLSTKLGGLLPAIEIAIFLGECSYTKMEALGPLYGWDNNSSFRCKRDFDSLGDDCLKELLQRVSAAHYSLDKDYYGRLKESVDYLRGYGITTYFPLSFELLRQLS